MQLGFLLLLWLTWIGADGKITNDEYELEAGRVARYDEFPYVVSIQFKYSKKHGLHYCTGSLVTSNKVVSTSYCIFWRDSAKRLHPFNVDDLVVVTGSMLNFELSEQEHRNVIELMMHPSVNIDVEAGFMTNDAGVLVLEKAVKKHEYIAPIDFFSYSESELNSAWQDLIASKEVCSVAGWRISEIKDIKTQDINEASKALQVLQAIPIHCGDILCKLNPNVCGLDLKSMGISCVKSMENFPPKKCQWRSGSSLVCKGSLWGVASFYEDDRDCSTDRPWIFVRPSALIKTLRATNLTATNYRRSFSPWRSSNESNHPTPILLFEFAILFFSVLL